MACRLSSRGPGAVNPFGPDTPVEQLRETARERLSTGQLPVIGATRLQANYGGPAPSVNCAVPRSSAGRSNTTLLILEAAVH
jgi:hypothetical protein